MVKTIKMPSIAFVVARSYPENIIGCNNKLPWHLREDLKRFKSITINHAIIMGRKTFDSIGRALPDRLNVVLSREDGNAKHNLIWCKTIEDAMFWCDVHSILNNRKEFFVIGGENIFSIFEDLFNRIHLTLVFSGGQIKGDSYFDYNFDGRKWKTIIEKEVGKSDYDEYPSRYILLNRKTETVRQVELSSFMRNYEEKYDWIAAMEGATPPPAHKFEDMVMEQLELFDR